MEETIYYAMEFIVREKLRFFIIAIFIGYIIFYSQSSQQNCNIMFSKLWKLIFNLPSRWNLCSDTETSDQISSE